MAAGYGFESFRGRKLSGARSHTIGSAHGASAPAYRGDFDRVCTASLPAQSATSMTGE